jgi:hypothetical protein
MDVSLEANYFAVSYRRLRDVRLIGMHRSREFLGTIGFLDDY